MPTREELHRLIDSLHEGAMEAAHRILTQLQVWPLPPPPGAEEMRRRMEERRMELIGPAAARHWTVYSRVHIAHTSPGVS